MHDIAQVGAVGANLRHAVSAWHDGQSSLLAVIPFADLRVERPEIIKPADPEQADSQEV